MPYLKLFYRLILRPLRHEPLRTALTVVAIALGVAAVLAIELAGDAAAGSFRSSMETLAGKADLEVTATGGVPADVLTRLATLPYALKLHPRIEGYALIPDRHRTVPVIGVDMLSEAALTESEIPSADAGAFQSDESIWAGSDLGLKPGDSIRLIINDTDARYTVRGLLGDRSGEVLAMDLAPASRVLRHGDTLDRILIETPPERSTEEWVKTLGEVMPPGVTVAASGASTEENRRMLAAFRWNLRVLSYITLTVGAFLIYNTISVSVVRRRVEIGILRALGATRAGVFAAFLSESAFFGLLGGLTGILLGRLMAEGALKLVASTVEALYVSSRPGPVALTWPVAVLCVAIGVGVSMVSAFAPAREASLVVPIEAMSRGRREHDARVHQFRSLLWALALATCAGIASLQQPIVGKPMFGYLSAILLIAASAMAIPALVTALTSATSSMLRRVFGVEALLAARSLAGSLRRTSVLVGALSTAIAMLAAVGIMVGSFRQTVLIWMDDRLQADLYLQPAAPPATDRHPTLAPNIAGRLAELPGVEAVDQFRAYEISYEGMPATVGGGDARVAGRYGSRPFLSGINPRVIFGQLIGHDNVIVSEPFANKHHVQRGDVITLPLGERRIPFRVIDIYYDYSNERGFIVMDRGTLLKYLPDPSPTNIAVYLKPGIAVDEARRSVEAAVAGRSVLVLANRTLREEGLRIFDRTFAITYALEAVAVFVAVMGIGGALLALVIDRRREFGLLRFLGGAGSQLRRMILFEAGLLGLLANVAGLILGVLLSLLLIFVINRQSFGWTIQFHWPVAILLGALSVVYLATVLAGLYPARIATHLVPIEVIHEE